VANTQLANPSETAVVAPNVDTLYGTAIFDLSIGDLVITVPNVDPGRYWSVSLFDPSVFVCLNVHGAKRV
jgi:hypothetical protein